MEYRNFDIELYEYEESGQDESFKVRVTNSPAGDQSPSEAERVALPKGLDEMNAYFVQQAITDRRAIKLGEALAESLLPPRVRQRWTESMRFLKEDEGLRLRLKFDAWQVARLPWELVYIAKSTAWAGGKAEDGFLALDRQVSIVRYEYTDYPLIPFQPGDDVTIRLLALLSSPPHLPPVDLPRKAASIEKSLQSVTNLTQEFLVDPTVEALQEALEHPTHILHFAAGVTWEPRMSRLSGSAETASSLSLSRSDGKYIPFPARKLALNLARCGVRIAFLDSSYSSSRDRTHRLSGLAPALSHIGIPVVIGFNGDVLDSLAAAFSSTFYRNLAAGSSVDKATAAARLAMFNQTPDIELGSWAQPVLYLRSDDSTLFPIRPGWPKPSRARSPVPSTLALRQMLVKSFEKEELELLCADVTSALERDRIQQRVNLEIVGGSSLEAIALNLIQHLERRGLLSYLVEAVRAARPTLFEEAEA